MICSNTLSGERQTEHKRDDQGSAQKGKQYSSCGYLLGKHAILSDFDPE